MDGWELFSQQYQFTSTAQSDLSLSRESLRCVCFNSITFQGTKCKKKLYSVLSLLTNSVDVQIGQATKDYNWVFE